MHPADIEEPQIATKVIAPEGPFSRIRKQPVRFSILIALLLFSTVGIFAYIRFSRSIAARLLQGQQGSAVVYYAAPRKLVTGDTTRAIDLISELKASGYTDSPAANHGYYTVRTEGIEIHPGPSYGAAPARVSFANNRIARIVSLEDRRNLPEYALEPEPFANIQGGDRVIYRDLRYADIPRNLMHAILSAEDKHFFKHAGFDPGRIAKAIYVNWKTGKKEQGGSTLTMQLARNLFLGREKTWKRKTQESLITIVLEQRLSKPQILELYCNKIYLGRHATYNIFGFAAAARVYFDKNVEDLTVSESALLAGMAQRPTYFDPTRNPDSALARRNVVLAAMRQNGYLDDATRETASRAALSLKPRVLDPDSAPFFLSLASDEVQEAIGDDAAGARIYTTLDRNLEIAAKEAVDEGMKVVLAALKGRRRSDPKSPMPQVALIALDPHTGEIKAVVGGRSYAESQLNHALSKRQPGSVFKPFVYAAALQNSGRDLQSTFTPGSTVEDEPTTFQFGRLSYTPGNFGQRFYGRVTLRQALAHSLNVATIKVAQSVGFNRVVELAHNAGMNDAIRATPSVALGSYETTPLEIAGAYTVFANGGVYEKPTLISGIQIGGDRRDTRPQRQSHQVLTPQVSFLMQDMLQEVVRSGTAARVRSLGVTVPVAGKTGTSHDGWFAGFSAGLLCIVWVGFDDNRELGLEGARSALPIWAAFMKRATRYKEYGGNFNGPPSGIATAMIDPESGQLAGPDCPAQVKEYFVEGTLPATECDLHRSVIAEVDPMR